jgi:hypothetical protein
MARARTCPNGSVILTLTKREASAVCAATGSILGDARLSPRCELDRVFHAVANILPRSERIPIGMHTGTITFENWPR